MTDATSARSRRRSIVVSKGDRRGDTGIALFAAFGSLVFLLIVFVIGWRRNLDARLGLHASAMPIVLHQPSAPAFTFGAEANPKTICGIQTAEVFGLE